MSRSLEVFCNLTAFAGLVLLQLSPATSATADPLYTSWQTNSSTQIAKTREIIGGSLVTTWPATGLYINGNSFGQKTPVQSDIQQMLETPNDLIIYSNNLSSHIMGPWYSDSSRTSLFGFWPSALTTAVKIPRSPQAETATTHTAISSGGDMAVLVNGVVVYAPNDAASYIPGGPGGGQDTAAGQKIWNRSADYYEGATYDPAAAHQPENGQYHVHSNPIGLRYQLGDNVVFTTGSASTLDTYVESTGTLHHSPIVAWSYDGYPIYGPYGYSTAMDSGSTVRRMVSGYQKRNGTNGTTNLPSTGRTTLPTWAALVHTPYTTSTLAPSQQGPVVNGTRPLGYYDEDYEFLGDVGVNSGYDLDRYNGRFCVTPDYPSGTYAYFTTINSNGTYAFPCMVGPMYYGKMTGGKIPGDPPGTATVKFTAIQDVVKDGSASELNYTINPTKGATGQALGRFAVMPSSTGYVNHGAFTINLGAVTGLSNLKLERTTTSTYSSPTQVGSTIASPGSTVTFNDNYTTSAATYYWLKGDVSVSATGVLDARLTTYTVTGATASSFGGSDALANNSIALSPTTTYTWNVNGSGDYQVANNWSPSRSTPTTNDDLIINTTNTPNASITNVTNEGINSLSITGTGGTVTINSIGNRLTLGASSNCLSVATGCTVNVGTDLSLAVSSNVTINGTLNMSGELDLGGYVASGSGNVVISGSLYTAHPSGINLTGATGAIQTTSRSFANGSSYYFTATGSQVTGTGLPASITYLETREFVDLTLSTSTLVSDQMIIYPSSTVNTGANTLAAGGNIILNDNCSLTVASGGRLSMNSGSVTTGASPTAFTLASGATLETKSVNGIRASAASGAIQTTSRSFSTGANYIFDGTSLQVTGDGLPSTVNNLTISNSNGVRLSSAVSVAGALSITGAFLTGTNAATLNSSAAVNSASSLTVENGGGLYAGSVTVTGAGNFALASGGTLETKNASGISSSGATGAIQNTGTRTFSAGATYIYDGLAGQGTGNGMPSTVSKINIANGTTVTLSQDTTVTAELDLWAGALVTTGRTFTVGETTVIDDQAGRLVGPLTRVIDMSIVGARSFPVGSTSKDAPIYIVSNFAGTGTGTITVSTTDGDPPNVASPTGVLDRYWTITGTSGLNLSGTDTWISFNYNPSDVSGSVNTSTMIPARYSNGGWQELPAYTRGTNYVTTGPIPGFSIWTLANPSAVPVSVSSLSIE